MEKTPCSSRCRFHRAFGLPLQGTFPHSIALAAPAGVGLGEGVTEISHSQIKQSEKPPRTATPPQHEQQRKEYETEQQREAEFAKRDSLRKQREASFELIVAEAPPVFTAAQLRVILRALVNLDLYTFADDLAADIEDFDNDKRSVEEVLLSAIDGIEADKLTSFATRLALAGHRGIPRENEIDLLTEAEAAFLLPKRKKDSIPKKQPTVLKPIKAAANRTKTKNAVQSKEDTVAA